MCLRRHGSCKLVSIIASRADKWCFVHWSRIDSSTRQRQHVETTNHCDFRIGTPLAMKANVPGLTERMFLVGFEGCLKLCGEFLAIVVHSWTSSNSLTRHAFHTQLRAAAGEHHTSTPPPSSSSLRAQRATHSAPTPSRLSGSSRCSRDLPRQACAPRSARGLSTAARVRELPRPSRA